MSLFHVRREPHSTDQVTDLTVGFGETATNAQIVAELENETLKGLEIGGGLVRISGPMSLPVCAVLVHFLVHRFGATAIYDPKCQGYVVAVSHDPRWTVGQVLSKY
jgi:CRISPR-associated protein Csx3